MIAATPSRSLMEALQSIVPAERVLTSATDRAAFASDASFYRLIPQAVVRPATVAEVQALFALASARGVPLTFRAAGTSLSGQSITDGILLDISRHWRRLAVEDGGARVRVQPGVVGAAVNRSLRPHGRRMGPDPASINACMMGGILANNSSGMCCGVRDNAYHTLQSMTFVLPDGGVWDSARDAERFASTSLAQGLRELRARVLSDKKLCARIRQKYRIKNTTGYGLNAFLDFDAPLELLSHLMIGSEGTLGFIAEAVLRSVEDPPLRASGLFVFASAGDACDAVPAMAGAGAAALELMDRASLASVENQRGIPAAVKGLPDDATAVLVEFQAGVEQQLIACRQVMERWGKELRLIAPPLMAADEAEREALWRIRKGLYPSVGAVRDAGTTVIIEDIAVPVERLGAAVRDLQRLFLAHGYPRGIVFGHARDGNLHFVVTQSFNDDRAIAQYGSFIEAVVEMIVSHGGSIKAEHGTGRNMAPFVEREWGTTAMQLMRDLKASIDPAGILNPGVIVTDDARAHVHHLKDCPMVFEEVDKCIECGFCEHLCPSRDLTMTPRQRIVAMREVARGTDLGRAVWDEFSYPGVETCAADGMCATACPVSIDTGRLVKHLRAGKGLPTRSRDGVPVEDVCDGRARVQGIREELAWRMARHFAWMEGGARAALRAGHLAQRLFGTRFVNAALGWIERMSGARLPRWLDTMPVAASAIRSRYERLHMSGEDGHPLEFVYFPTCISRVMGASRHGEPAVPQLLFQLAARAGVRLVVPRDLAGTCCGMPFSSKGLADTADEICLRTLRVLDEASDSGEVAIVVDNSSCAFSLKEYTPEESALRVLDAVEFAHDVLLPRLQVRRRLRSVAVHPVCSIMKMGLTEKLLAVATACAEHAEVPAGAGCCATAGDRGFLYPELLASATRVEVASLQVERYDRRCASNRMCEVGLSHASGQPFESFLALLEYATSL